MLRLRQPVRVSTGVGLQSVADEVRKLAEQSQSEAIQIASIINAMLTDIRKVVQVFSDTTNAMNTGVTTIHKVNTSLRDITKQVDITLNDIQDVSHLTDNQADSVAKLVEFIHQVAAVSQEASAATQTTASNVWQANSAVETVTNDAKSLSKLTAILQEGVMCFKIRPTKTIRVSFVLTDKSTSYSGMKKFAELLERRTQGRYELKIFHSGQLGEDPTVLERMKNGTLEMTFMSSTPVALLNSLCFFVFVCIRWCQLYSNCH